MRTAMMYGTPMIEAQAMPSPMMGMNSMYLLWMCGKITRPTAAHNRHDVCTHLAPRRRASATSGKATQKVTMLYQPLTRPVHQIASANSGDFGSVVSHTALAIDSPTNCQ